MSRARWNIEVTQEDIDRAHVGDSYRCVVAQAIARQIPAAHHIDVDIQTIRWSDENGRHVLLTPYAVSGYVVAFDAGDEIHPFDFQLRNPVPTIQKAAKKDAAKRARRASDKVVTEKRRVKNAEAVLAQPDVSPERMSDARKKVEEGPARIAAAKQENDSIRAAYTAAGEPHSKERVSETTRKPPPKVQKTKKRAYGHRVLRVNQAPGRTHFAG